MCVPGGGIRARPATMSCFGCRVGCCAGPPAKAAAEQPRKFSVALPGVVHADAAPRGTVPADAAPQGMERFAVAVVDEGVAEHDVSALPAVGLEGSWEPDTTTGRDVAGEEAVYAAIGYSWMFRRLILGFGIPPMVLTPHADGRGHNVTVVTSPPVAESTLECRYDWAEYVCKDIIDGGHRRQRCRWDTPLVFLVEQRWETSSGRSCLRR